MQLMLQASGPSTKESQYYRIRAIPNPDNHVLEIGGLDVREDGVVGACTRRGEVFLISGVFDDGNGAKQGVKYSKLSEGLHEPLGLLFDDAGVLCVQRGELTKIFREPWGSTRFVAYCDLWPLSGNYHEYSYGPKRDLDKNLWMTFNLAWIDQGESLVPWRGFAAYLTPEGKFVPACAGLRSPAGIGLNASADVFVTDNQGDWVATNKLSHMTPGGFYGHPESLKWCSLPESVVKPRPKPRDGMRLDEVRDEFKLPAVWFPYKKMGQSASDIVCDTSGGKFGPFDKQLFVGDQTTSEVMRVFLEKVDGEYQGACFPFVRGFACGITRLAFAPNGSLVAGMTNRGWPSVGSRDDGLQILTWTGVNPFEILEMRARPEGFELVFTEDVDPKSAGDPASYSMESFTYLHHERYGSDEIDKKRLDIAAAKVSPDRRRVTLTVKGLRRAFVHALDASGVRSSHGKPLLHAKAFYTLNRIP
jgi:hypothetical protein